MSESGVVVEEIAHLAGYSSFRTTKTIYRHELRPVITTGADVMDRIFIWRRRRRRKASAQSSPSSWPSSVSSSAARLRS
jgi:hypothetical protein